MSSTSLFDQLLNDPENITEGMAKAIVDQLKTEAVDRLLAEVRPTLEKMVEEKLERFRMAAARHMDTNSFNPTVDFKLWWAEDKDK